ncbi:MAG: hypothetical protein QF475_01110 [Candidatus Undinarchaeales archaeon]|jgi:hypothetical protein|nr:hypothetical protein [Candidatus Undinarchaeales archaeon]
MDISDTINGICDNRTEMSLKDAIYKIRSEKGMGVGAIIGIIVVIIIFLFFCRGSIPCI